MNKLSIDPGIGGTGWCVFSNGGTPLRCGVVKSGKGEWITRARRVSKGIIRECKPKFIDTIIIEWPEYHRGKRGFAAAARGDLVKLSVLTGMILDRYPDAKAIMLPPSSWKGQLPKDLVADELVRHLGKEMIRKLGLPGLADHAWDAVGIGLVRPWKMKDEFKEMN